MKNLFVVDGHIDFLRIVVKQGQNTQSVVVEAAVLGQSQSQVSGADDDGLFLFFKAERFLDRIFQSGYAVSYAASAGVVQ